MTTRELWIEVNPGVWVPSSRIVRIEGFGTEGDADFGTSFLIEDPPRLMNYFIKGVKPEDVVVQMSLQQESITFEWLERMR